MGGTGCHEKTVLPHTKKLAVRKLILCFFRYPNAEFFVYTGDIEVTPDEILKKVKTVMNVDLDGGVNFVYMTKRRWLEAERYPYFTLLLQCLGSIYLGFEALAQLNPGCK